MRGDLEDRLQEFAALKKGWFDGEGEPIPPSVIEQARAWLEHLLAEAPGLTGGPYLYPSFTGGVRVEFDITDPEGDGVEVEFEPGGISYFGPNGESEELSADRALELVLKIIRGG